MKQIITVLMFFPFLQASAQSDDEVVQAFGRQVYQCVRYVDSVGAKQLVPSREIAFRYVEQVGASPEARENFAKRTEEHHPKLLREIGQGILAAHLSGKENGIDWEKTTYVATTIDFRPEPREIRALGILVYFQSGNVQYDIRVRCIIVDGQAYLVHKPYVTVE